MILMELFETNLVLESEVRVQVAYGTVPRARGTFGVLACRGSVGGRCVLCTHADYTVGAGANTYLIIKAYARGAPLRESYYFTQVRYFARLSRFTPVSGICIYSGIVKR